MISESENLRRRDANYRPLTPIHFLLRSADVFPERVAVIDGARSFTWRQYADRCLRLASALRKRGIGQERHRSRRVKSPSPRGPQARSAKARRRFRRKYSGVRSALRVLRTYDTVPYCARPWLLIRNRINQNFL